MNNEILFEVKKLCDLIVNSKPETPIKGEIESLAFNISQHPDILNLNIQKFKIFSDKFSKIYEISHKD